MTTKVTIPSAGMGTTEGMIAKWRKAEGDLVVQGEPLVDIETAKAVEEVPAPVTGVLTKILLHEGQTGEVNAEIALIEEARQVP